MEPPVVTRRRRPFLALVWVTILGGLIAAGIGLAVFGSARTTVVVLVRPVEKELGTIDDPPLSPEGEQRAQRLAQMFGAAKGAGGLDALYVSDVRRAQQTAAPLADRLGIRPVVVAANDVVGAAARVMREHDGGTVLIIASGNTLPQLVRELSGLEIGINEDEPNTLYIVSLPTFGHPNMLRLKY